jgi:hypothetical protein
MKKKSIAVLLIAWSVIAEHHLEKILLLETECSGDLKTILVNYQIIRQLSFKFNRKKSYRNFTNTWRLSFVLLNDYWIIEDIKG